jgi:uncharacterized protein YqeY
MTLKEQIESIYLSTEGLEDRQSIETRKILRIIKQRIVSYEYNIGVDDLKDSYVARLIESLLNSVSKWLSYNEVIIKENAEYQYNILNNLLPSKLTESELTEIISSLITDNPSLKIDELIVYLDDFFYDSRVAISIYESFNETNS